MSLLRVNQLQIGQSQTPSNNIALLPDATTPGQAKLVRGNTGAEIADLLVFKPDGRVELGKASEAVESGRVLVDADYIERYIAQYLQNILFESTGMVLFKSAITTTWQVPEVLRLGLKKAKVTVVAGGGGGGYSDWSSSRKNSGGGGGGGAVIFVTSLKGVSSVSLTVGRGGAGGSNGVAAVAGTDSKFADLAIAYGGKGGVNGGAAGYGGSSSSSVDGALVIHGSAGLHGSVVDSVTEALSGGAGGASIFGGAPYGPIGSPDTKAAKGFNGLSFGSGGSGTVGVDGQGGQGRDGLVMIEW